MKSLQLTTLALLASVSLAATASQPNRVHHNNVPLAAEAGISNPPSTAQQSNPQAKSAVDQKVLTSTYRKHHNNVVISDANAIAIADRVAKLPASAAGNLAPAGQ
jgi:hypothetical protein